MIGLRIKYYEMSADAMAGFLGTKQALEQGPLDIKLIELIYLRISQINGCSYCLNMHTNSLLKYGESTRRLSELAGWRVSTEYTDNERAALNWAEQLTDIAVTHADESAFDELKKYYNDKEISDLTFAISLMNAMNRLAISMRQ